MPMYDFVCNKCKHEFEDLLPIKDRDKATCPKCKSKDVEQLLTGCGFIVKWKRGRGYTSSSKTPYRNKNCDEV